MVLNGRDQYTRWLQDIQYETGLFRENWGISPTAKTCEGSGCCLYEQFNALRDVKTGRLHQKSRQSPDESPN
ncbi:hypothetical protein NY605_01575, partial [Enterobacter hormaechei]|nr:hypothetical protein [Enterobacter hormaechei]